MSNKHGDFIWYELLTGDTDGAQKFYGGILGWQFTDSGQAHMDYRILLAKDEETGAVNRVGGLLQLTEDMKAGGARPIWLGYVGVDDVDASVEEITDAGGSVQMPATDIPGVGRLAMVTDPQGTPFYVMRGSVEGTSLAFASDKPRPGHCDWNELATSNPKAALAFYGDQFGWKKDGEMDMGSMGAYEFLRHGGLIGAIMRKPDGMPVSMWTFYFRVPEIDTAADKIRTGGGRIVQEPHEIPGGDFILHGIDPQGAGFALIGGRA